MLGYFFLNFVLFSLSRVVILRGELQGHASQVSGSGGRGLFFFFLTLRDLRRLTTPIIQSAGISGYIFLIFDFP